MKKYNCKMKLRLSVFFATVFVVSCVQFTNASPVLGDDVIGCLKELKVSGVNGELYSNGELIELIFRFSNSELSKRGLPGVSFVVKPNSENGAVGKLDEKYTKPLEGMTVYEIIYSIADNLEMEVVYDKGLFSFRGIDERPLASEEDPFLRVQR